VRERANPVQGGLVEVKLISAGSRRVRVAAATSALLAVCAIAAFAAGGAAGRSAGSGASPVRVAYLSFAVANSYDAPMLAAAKDVAKKQGAKVTVLDAANDPKKQLAEFQTVVTSKQYDAVIVQPIFGPQLIPTVNSAIKAGLKVVN